MSSLSFRLLFMLLLLAAPGALPGTAHGAVVQLVVTTAVDELDPLGTPGSGTSLREAMRDAPDGASVGFDPAVFQGEPADVITLTIGRLELAGKSLTIDASDIPGGVTVSGNGASQVFAFDSAATATVKGLIITGGRAGQGGGIGNSGHVTLQRCRITGNTATEQAGGFQNFSAGVPATLVLEECVIAGNTAPFGGGGLNISETAGALSSVILRRCAVAGNHATTDGGGLENYASAGQCALTLEQSTLAGNTAASVGGGLINFSNGGVATVALRHTTVAGNSALLGNGIRNNSVATSFTVSNSIIAANPAPGHPDVYGLATSLGGNLIGNSTNFVMPPASGDQIGTAGAPIHPLLAPLGHYGGFTQTLALLPGSPARDAALAAGAVGFSTDQRGFARENGQVDIGAYEAGTLLDYDAWSWETFPGGIAPAAHAATFDNEQDGRNNALEYASLTQPLDVDTGSPLSFTPDLTYGTATIVFPVRFSATDLRYTIERTFDLGGAWMDLASYDTATGAFATGLSSPDVIYGPATITFTDAGIAGQPQVFYRLRATVSAP